MLQSKLVGSCLLEKQNNPGSVDWTGGYQEPLSEPRGTGLGFQGRHPSNAPPLPLSLMGLADQLQPRVLLSLGQAGNWDS